MPAAFDALAPHQAIEAWLRAVFAANAYIDAHAPWSLRKTNPVRMEAVLATLYKAIARLAVGISPVIPTSAATVLTAMGLAPALRSFSNVITDWYDDLFKSDFKLSQPTPLFPRLEFSATEIV